MKQKALLSFVLMLFFSFAWSQSRTITGKVTKENSTEGLAGVSVTVKGTRTATTTDNSGQFKITAGDKSTLVFTSIGFKSREVSVSGNSSIDVSLAEDVTSLDDVVVVGYTSMRRRDVTTSVSSVSARDLKDIPLNSAAEAITGRLAGVNVTTTEGRPGADVLIRVRGGGSITQDNTPLYIVDGIQVENALSILSPQEIQSIDVLKDAASTAIYGARGANGVVVITTKGGREMKTQVTYNGFVGVRSIAKKLDVLKPYDYVLYQYQRYNGSVDDRAAFQTRYGRWEDLDIYKNVPFVDWQDRVFGRDALSQTHNLNLTGGTKNTTFNLTLNHADEEGIMLESGYRRSLASFKFDHRVTDRFRVGFSTRYSRQRIEGVGTSATGSQSNNRLRNTVRYIPYIAPGQEGIVDQFDADYANLTNLTSPVLLAHNELRYDNRNDVNVTGYVSLELIKGLTFKSTAGMTNTDTRVNAYNGSVTSVARQNANLPVVVINTGNGLAITNSNTLNYKKTFSGSHNVSVLVGQEIYQTKSSSFNATTKWMSPDLTPDQAFAQLDKFTAPAGGIQDKPTTSQSATHLASFFGQAYYSYKSKYTASVAFRRDGSSLFGPLNRWGNFPSAALAWRISQEKFMDNVRFINDLKLRFSYGASGNNRLPVDAYKTMFGTNTSSYAFDESVQTGIAAQSFLSNPSLQWETTVSRNLGLDFSLFKNRISGSIDAYVNNTKDLLLLALINGTVGYTNQYQNTGKTENKGIELQLNADVVRGKKVTWNVGFNIAHNENKIVSLGTSADGTPLNSYKVQSGWVNALEDFYVEVGKPMGQFYGYVTDGFYTTSDFNYDPATQKYTLKAGVANSSAAALGNRLPQPGDLKLKRLSGDSLIGEKDKTILGNAQPKFTGGFSTQVRYGGFDLSILANFSYGNKVYNANNLENTTTYQYKDNNMLAIMADRYKLFDANGVRVTDPAELDKLNANAKYWTPSLGNYFLHSFAIEDGSFFRISNITIGYTIPSSVLKKTHVISGFRVYATVNNLYTFTKYTGYDPEANTRRSPLTPGVDYAAYPRSRFILAGVNVTF
jgi:TonB-linked SusC/RagA family outer membrane protein